MDRSIAWILAECIRTVLRDTRRRTWDAADFQSNIDALMRLPFGLHWWSESLALFLGKDARVLSVDEQIAAFVNAFIETPDDYETAWGEEMRPRLGEPHEIPNVSLAEIVSEFPNNALIQIYLSACEDFDVELSNKPVPYTKGEITIGEDTEIYVDAELVPHTKGGITNQYIKIIPGRLGECPARLKQIGQAILDEGFAPGGSFQYYVNKMKGVKGQNAIGWAIVVHDGDREKAKEFLDQQAEDVPGTKADIAARKALIAWCIDGNDTYERFMAWKGLSDHRALDVDVNPAFTVNAERIVAALPALRQASKCHTKVFTDKSLNVIKHTLAIMQTLCKASPDGLAQISERTLAAQMPDNINRMDVARNMRWITFDPAIDPDEQDCLIEALEIVERPKKATEPTIYRLGPGI